MPRTSEQNEAIRKKRMTQIIETAKEIYLEKGVHSLEMGEVSERSGLGRGTIYHYYSNKYDLLKQVFNELIESCKKIVDETIAKGGEPIERLEMYFRKQGSILVQDPKLCNFFKNVFKDIQLVYGNDSNEILGNFQTNLVKPVSDTILEAMDKEQIIRMEPEKLAQILFGTLVGAVTNLVHSSEELDNSIKEDIMYIIFNGIKIK